MIELDPEKNLKKFLQDNPLPVGDEFYPPSKIIKTMNEEGEGREEAGIRRARRRL